MKICYASQSFYPHIGGVSTYLLNLAKEIVKRGNEVTEVHLRPSGEESTDEIKGIKIHRVPKEPIDNKLMEGYSKFKEAVYSECLYDSPDKKFEKKIYEIPGYHEFNKVNHFFGAEIAQMLEQDQPDIVHIHDFQLLFTYRYVPRGTSLIFTWHIPFREDMPKNLSQFLIRHMMEYDKVVFSSMEYIKAAIKAGLPKEKAELIYPVANTNLFRKMDVDDEKIKKNTASQQRAKSFSAFKGLIQNQAMSR
jgi:trehalose-6-phosphate synthase